MFNSEFHFWTSYSLPYPKFISKQFVAVSGTTRLNYVEKT